MQMAQDLNQILLGEINGFSSAGDDEAFLRNVVGNKTGMSPSQD